MIGAVVCCAAAVGGDNLQDLKAGYLVGATPWKQQLMLCIGAFSCALVMAPVLNLLAQAYGIGAPTPDHPNELAAPQANLMASVAKGMFGGHLPRSEEHTSELQSLMRTSYAVFCFKKKHRR